MAQHPGEGGWGGGARRAGAPDGMRARVVLVRGGLRLRGGERRIALARGLAQCGDLRRPPSVISCLSGAAARRSTGAVRSRVT